MPIAYTIDVPAALIVTRCVGAVTLSEVLEHFRELRQVWPPVDRLDVLLDLREMTSLPSLEELVAVAAEIDAQIGPHKFDRCAVVTNQEPLRESMRTFEAFTHRLFDGGVQIFRTPEGGLMWLAPKPSSARTLTRP